MVFLARFFCIRLPHLINIGILAAYFLFYPNIQAWPHRFVWWVWLPFFVYCWLGHFVSTLRYVTRGVAGAYLSKDGDRPDKNLVSLVQAELFPDATIPHMFFHSLITIVSFSLILLVQGWATALLAVVGWIIVDSAFSSFLPINSLNHLERIYKHSRLYVHRLARTGDPGMLKYGIFPWDVSDFIGEILLNNGYVFRNTDKDSDLYSSVKPMQITEEKLDKLFGPPLSNRDSITAKGGTKNRLPKAYISELVKATKREWDKRYVLKAEEAPTPKPEPPSDEKPANESPPAPPAENL